MHRSQLATLLAFSTVLACGTETLTPVKRTPAEQVAGSGGTTGGPINGYVTFFLIDENEAPIVGATVLVDDQEAVSDANGEVEFEVAQGPVTVHMFADGRIPLSVVGIDARSVTVTLWKPDISFDFGTKEAEIGRIAGLITGWDRLPPLVTTSPNTVSERFAWVLPIASGETPFIQQQTRENSDYATDYAIGGVFEDYALMVDAPTTKALYAFGGRYAYDFDTDEDETLTTHLGVLLDLDLAPGQTLDGRNIDLSHALEPMDVSFQDVPSELTQVDGYISLGLPRDNGTISVGPTKVASGRLHSVNAPRLEGTLEGSEYIVDAFAGGDNKSSYIRTSGTDRPVVVSGFLSPPASVGNSGRTVTAEFASPTTFQAIYISKEVESQMDPNEGPPDEMPTETVEVNSFPIWNIIDLSGQKSLSTLR